MALPSIVLRAGDRASQWRGHKRDKVHHPFRLGRASDRYAAEGFHQTLARTLVIGSQLLCQLCD
jgi:hypothetical protein